MGSFNTKQNYLRMIRCLKQMGLDIRKARDSCQFKTMTVGKTFYHPIFTSKDWEIIKDIMEQHCRDLQLPCTCNSIFFSFFLNCIFKSTKTTKKRKHIIIKPTY